MIESFKLPVITKETVSGSVASFNSEYAELPLDELIVAITATQEGSGTPSPDNVRPIVGYTQADIGHCGVNFMSEFEEGEYELNGIKATVTSNNLVTITGQKTISGGMNLTIPLKSNYIIPRQAYVHFRNSIANASIVLTFRTSSSAYIAPSITPVNRIYRTPDNISVITSMNIYFGGNVTEELNFTLQPTIELTNEVTDFTPYNGNTYTIPFGQTVYGGTLDVLTGLLTVTHGIVDLGTLSWYQKTGNTYNTFYCNFQNDSHDGDGLYCSNYETTIYAPAYYGTVDKIVSATSQYNNIFVVDDNYSSASDFKAGMNGVQLAYKLKTPIEIQLTPAQVETIVGQNNIWADTGDTSVKFLKVR